MVPGKPEDFTRPHGGFKGEKEYKLHAGSGWTVEICHDCKGLVLMYAAPAGWRFRWSPDSTKGVILYPLPLFDRDAK